MANRSLVLFLLLTFAGLGASTAGAVDTIALYADFGGDEPLERTLITKPGEPFDVVVVTDASMGSNGIEFIMTELSAVYGGVFKVSTTAANDSNMDLGDQDVGEHVIAYRACMPEGLTEALRIRYHDIDGSLPANVVLSLRGFGPGDTLPSSFDGDMGYSVCNGGKQVLTPAPWEPVAGFDPTRIEGLTSTDGILILNPVQRVPAVVASMGALKARF